MKTPWSWIVVLFFLGGIECDTTVLKITSPTEPERLPVLSKQSQCEDLVAWIPPRSDPAVVLQVVSTAYLELELNFIYHMELHSTFSRDNLLIICLDEESSAFLKSQLGIRCAEYHYEGDAMARKDIWALRTLVASCLLRAGHDMLLSDADAIWLKDPIEYMSLVGAKYSNVVASRGSNPKHLGHAWGSTLCFGFILFRAGGAGMSTLINTVRQDAARLGNDQWAINEALNDFGIAWDPESDMVLDHSTRVGRGTVERLRDSDGEFVVTLLPHSTFTRRCGKTPLSNDTVVAHCHSPEKGESMERWMKQSNLWVNFSNVTHQFSPP